LRFVVLCGALCWGRISSGRFKHSNLSTFLYKYPRGLARNSKAMSYFLWISSNRSYRSIRRRRPIMTQQFCTVRPSLQGARHAAQPLQRDPSGDLWRCRQAGLFGGEPAPFRRAQGASLREWEAMAVLDVSGPRKDSREDSKNGAG
jgi:hypothetical protein